jgi:hypothetical protein
MSQRLEDISAQIKAESTRTDSYHAYGLAMHPTVNAYGSTKDKDDKDGVEALKKYIDRINKDVIDPLADAINDISLETTDLKDIDGTDKLFAFTVNISTVRHKQYGLVEVEANKIPYNTKVLNDDKHDNQLRGSVLSMLSSCKTVLKDLLKQKQAMDMMNLANKQSKQAAEQCSRLSGNGSLDYEAHKEARLATMGIVKANSIFARITTLNEKMVSKCCTLAASLQSCVKPNSTTLLRTNGPTKNPKKPKKPTNP